MLMVFYKCISSRRKNFINIKYLYCFCLVSNFATTMGIDKYTINSINYYLMRLYRNRDN